MNPRLDLHTRAMARQTMFLSRWGFGAAVVIGTLTTFRGIAPLSYLLPEAGFGFLFFALLILAWRWRSDLLRCGTGPFIMFWQMVLYRHDGRFGIFEIQGFAVIFAISLGLLWFLRPWIDKFARLTESSA